ncbi:extracellular serine/threonine protein CG31145-like [Physella acuta]|uniref:extracellular serine/threonine protein CG31145-like n=1 Tax=Physella acuta TaxID=109671 RepID=UPI0027DCBA6E|nr:extracellular serine/threonine protein CG31145-like [Physella acuta]XP_059167497.1 extracellular serine/threonine protein CG31145-like [Physella acuta]XP_059167498.1 extracellular serine/threonine protein CG31145-like [Physella acuta]
MWMIIRRRWRVLMGVTFTLVVMINAAIFLLATDPRVRQLEAEDTHWDAPHLQVSRKRLNKSGNNSTGLNYPDSELTQGAVGPDPAPREAGDTIRQFTSRQVAPAKTQEVANEEEDGEKAESRVSRNRHHNGTYRDKEEEGDEGVGPVLANHRNSDPLLVSQKRGQGFGARANYSIAEVDEFVEQFASKYKNSLYDVAPEVNYPEFLKRLNDVKKKGPRLDAFTGKRGKQSWEQFHHGIRQYTLYDPQEPYLARLLNDMATEEVVDVEQKEGGTQIKLILSLADDGLALFKPMRFPRDQETLPDHFYFADYERHNAEIAAFHLDMVLGFHRVPPTIGRSLNVSHDLHRLANHKLAKTFFISPAGNWCFHGSCSYYCDSSHPICGHPMMLEGSLAAFLPPIQMAKRKTWRNPWKRSYSKHRKAYWEVYDDLCDKVRDKHPYNESRRLADVMDMAVFDFLTGNLDRHHYETFQAFGNDTFLLHLDNGRAFGKSKYDCISCIAPVRQCCMIRLSTLSKLIKLYSGPDSLSQIMRLSLHSDPLDPVLWEPHLDALDRRVSKVLHMVNNCIKDGRQWNDVIIDDGIT